MEIKEFYDKLDQKYMSGNQEEVRLFLNHTIKDHRPCCGGYNDIFLSAINELGSFQRGAGKYEESRNAFEESGEIIAEFMGTDSVEYATNRMNLAGTLRLMGKYEKALSLFVSVRELYEKHAGHIHYYTASAFNNEALTYIETGDRKKAQECLSEALHIIRELGELEEEEAITLVNLAAVTKEKAYLIQALDIYDSLLKKGVHYGTALNLLGTFYYEDGDLDRAETLFQQAKGEIGKVYGESEEYNQACHNLSLVLNAKIGGKK